MAAHKMKDGRRCDWLDLGSDPATGERLRKRVEARTKRAAEMKATALRERHARGENITDKARTLGQLLDDWIATMEERTRLRIRWCPIAALSPTTSSRTWARLLVPKLRARDIQNGVQHAGGSVRIVNPAIVQNVLVSALDWRSNRASAPITLRRRFAFPKRNARRAAYSALTRCARCCWPARAALRSGYPAGADGPRRGELSGLRWEDFDEQPGTLMIRRQIQRVNKQWTAIPPKDGSERC